MRKVLTKIHLWLSVPFGLIITITCLTGAILVFESDIMEMTRKDMYYVKQVENNPLAMQTLMENVSREIPDSVEITGVTIFANPERAYQVSLSKPRRASVFVDQYSGEITGHYKRSPFFLFNFKLHRWLLDSAKPDGGIFWGKMIVGTSTIMFVFVLITGLFIWIPKTRKALHNRLKVATNKGWKRFWYDLHVSAGFYAFILLLVMALTGLTWSFQWYRKGFYQLFGAEVTAPAPQPPAQEKTLDLAVAQQKEADKNNEGITKGSEERIQNGLNDSKNPGASTREHGEKRAQREGDAEMNNSQREHGGKREGNGKPFAIYNNWGKVYEQIEIQNPDFDKISITTRGASVSHKRWGNQRAADSYKFNPRSGEVTEVELYRDSNKASKLRGWILALHIGNWGGLFSKILTFIAAIIGASLPMTGYYLWIKRMRRKQKRNRE